MFQRLAQIQNENVKKAEVAAWFGRYDEAEKLYIEVDRRDLAISLRKKLGDWFKVFLEFFNRNLNLEMLCSLFKGTSAT